MSLRILITGATDGLGRALATRLAADGHQLLLHGRRPTALHTFAADLAHRSGSAQPPPQTLVADLADLSQVDTLASQIIDQDQRLDVVVNNAGIGPGEPDGDDRRTSRDGYELRFAVNYLAPALLTLRLRPRLQDQRETRIVNVASLAQTPVDFSDPMLSVGYSGQRAYAQSKLALITLGLTLAERTPAEQITINSLHPGSLMPTKMVLQSAGGSIDTLDTGVRATRRLIENPALAHTTGTFFDRDRPARAHAQAYDPEAREQLWTLTQQILNLPS